MECQYIQNTGIHQQACRINVVSPDSRILAVGLAEQGTIELLDTSTWEVVSAFDYNRPRSHPFGIQSVSMSPDGKTFASVPYGSNTISIWEYDTPDIPTSIEQSTWGAIKAAIGGRNNATEKRNSRDHSGTAGRSSNGGKDRRCLWGSFWRVGNYRNSSPWHPGRSNWRSDGEQNRIRS